MEADANEIIAIAEDAGKVIMDIYESGDFDEVSKQDEDEFVSPLTRADTQANELIVKRLAKASELPIVTEENELSHTIMANEFWLIDPLDGTKDFIKKNGEFTVNIALVKNGTPVFGVVHAPAVNATYWNENGKAFKKTAEGTQEIAVDPNPDEIVAFASRSHNSPETDDFLHRHNISKTMRAGSSLKFCLIAEGKAHVYPRFAPTMIWDTAAAHAVATAAGARIINAETGKELTYNLGELKNPFFICSSVDLESLS